MTNKIEYLEKYTVAPSPSRDYYGLKVLKDKVILYRWKVSRAPFKPPLTYNIKFSDFKNNKTIQDEISFAFEFSQIIGKSYLEYVKCIANGDENNLLTLPTSLIEKIAKYLQPSDIVNLSKLSPIAKELFDKKSIWESFKPHHPKFSHQKFKTTSPALKTSTENKTQCSTLKKELQLSTEEQCVITRKGVTII
ncbi:F-box only protein 36-like [Prorops nasuta]|uniref:F-box only protein 36-like n=1 Tax=Prorops nasuta TaxID=863751 RepID=UPI0034CEB533